MKVDEQTANRLKINIGLDKSRKKGKVYKALMPVVSDLVKQTKKYINFYHQQSKHVHAPNSAIGQILLCGGESLLPGLSTIFSEELGLSVSLANPFLKVNLLKEFKGKSLGYVTAIGLALREF